MSTLKERCAVFLDQAFGLAARPKHCEELLAFILAEQARRYAPKFVDAKPLVLWFNNDADRDAFTALWLDEHPSAKAIKVKP